MRLKTTLIGSLFIMMSNFVLTQNIMSGLQVLTHASLGIIDTNQQDNKTLQEITISVGYGTQKIKDATGSVLAIGVKDFNKGNTSGDYLWAWKGGEKEGKAVANHLQLYPLPATDILANTKLKQNTGY